MRKIAMIVFAVMVLSASFAGAAMAQTYPTTPPATSPAQPAPGAAQPGQYPTVANLKPFAAEANYMSLAGYLRYLVFQQTAQWLTHEEAVRIVGQQKGI